MIAKTEQLMYSSPSKYQRNNSLSSCYSPKLIQIKNIIWHFVKFLNYCRYSKFLKKSASKNEFRIWIWLSFTCCSVHGVTTVMYPSRSTYWAALWPDDGTNCHSCHIKSIKRDCCSLEIFLRDSNYTLLAQISPIQFKMYNRMW